MKPSVRFANDIIEDLSEDEEEDDFKIEDDIDGDGGKARKLQELAFEIESGLTRLDVSVKGLEILLEIDEVATQIVASNRRHERVASIQLNRAQLEDIIIDQKYLNWLQSELHLTQYRIITVSNIHTKNKQSSNYNDINNKNGINKTKSRRDSDIFESTYEAVEAQLTIINKDYSNLESMFNMLWKAWVKEYSHQQKEMIRRQKTEFKNREIASMFQDKNNDTNNNDISKNNSMNEDNNFEINSKIIKQGYMTKLGNIRKNWKKRLFILTNDGMLCYYNVSSGNHSHKKLKKKLLNEIDLSFASKITIISSNTNKYGKPFLLCLETPKREFIFSCENSKEQQSWITHLQQIITKCQQKATMTKTNHDKNDSNENDFKKNENIINLQNNFGSNISEQVLFMNLSKFEWKQLNTGDRLADLQEEFEDIADITLIPPNQIKITVVSETWIRNNTLRAGTISLSTIRAISTSFYDSDDNDNNGINNNDIIATSDSNIFMDLQHSVPMKHMKSVDMKQTSVAVNWSEIIDKLKNFLSQESHGDILKSGWLLKKLEWRNWKKRWCMLHFNGKFEWYESKNDDKVRGSMMLNDVLSIREISYLHFNGMYDRNNHAPDWIFEIETIQRKVRFACESQQQLNDWIAKLQSVSQFIKQNDAMRRRASSEISEADELVIQLPTPPKPMVDPIIV